MLIRYSNTFHRSLTKKGLISPVRPQNFMQANTNSSGNLSDYNPKFSGPLTRYQLHSTPESGGEIREEGEFAS